jgi:hypothetical protein
MMRALRCHFSPRHFRHYAILLLIIRPFSFRDAADAIAAMLIFAAAAITPFSPRISLTPFQLAAITLSPFRHCSIFAMPLFRHVSRTPCRRRCHFVTPILRHFDTLITLVISFFRCHYAAVDYAA